MSTRTLLSAEEFYEQLDQYDSCELVRGEVVPVPPAGWGHSRTNANVSFPLERWARKSRLGRVLVGEPGVITERDPDTVRGADVAYFSFKRLPKGQEPPGFAEVPPELIVEVVSDRQSRREAEQKAIEYLAMGVDRVWIANPRRRTLQVHRPDDEPQVLSGDDLLEDPDILPVFSCRVSEFFID